MQQNQHPFSKKSLRLKKNIKVQKSQQSDDEINLNEGVVYTAGGIGVKTQASQPQNDANKNNLMA